MLLIQRAEFENIAHGRKRWPVIGLVNLPKDIILSPVTQKRLSIEGHLSWLGFPGIIKMLAMLQGVFFVALLLNPAAVEVIAPNGKMLMQGEVWRLFSWVLMPPYPPFGESPVFPMLITLIVLRICFLFDETLEGAWGVTRTSIYVYATLLCQGLALNFLPSAEFSGSIYYLALFLPFATILPNYTFLLMFFLPVKVWILAALAGVGIAISCFQLPLFIPFYLIAYLPYLIYAIPFALKWRKARSQVTKRRNKFHAAQQSLSNSLHCCHNCGRTENSHPDLEFRVADDEEEYCLDHLP